MSKYYKAEDVINAIENKIAEYIPTLFGRYEEIPLELRMAIEHLPTIEVSEDCISRAEALDELWIPCSERLPKKNGIYLVTAIDYIFDTTAIDVCTCYFDSDYQFSKEILAWKPLPEPWKGVSDEH